MIFDSWHKRRIFLFLLIASIVIGICPAVAAPFKKLDRPPLTDHWYGIYVDHDRVGFYHQEIWETSEGYRFEGTGNVRIKVMGFSKDSSMHENYLVGKKLALRSFEVEQSNNGVLSRITGKVSDTSLRIKSLSNGKSTDKLLRFKGEIYPGPVLNLFPLMRDSAVGKSYKVQTFDPEEIKVKEVMISFLGEGKTPDGQLALKLRNTLYPFVNNDIWMDKQGNTIFESVRDGLVTTKAEDPKILGAFVGNIAIARKDLIYDFSLVRAIPPIKEQQKLKGLAVEISGWNDSLALLQEGGQVTEKVGEGRIVIRTGSAVSVTPVAIVATPTIPAPTPAPAQISQANAEPEAYLKPAEKIESDAPEIVAKAKEIAKGKNSQEEVVRALATWTADWLKDTVDDGGGALASLKSRYGNCQTHARLYTALARSAGIPTRFVSGLFSLEGKGFLYHSWAESRLGGIWIAVDPTFNQVPADPTHLKLFEGHTQDDLAPIIAIIGRIQIKVLETKYK